MVLSKNHSSGQYADSYFDETTIDPKSGKRRLLNKKQGVFSIPGFADRFFNPKYCMDSKSRKNSKKRSRKRSNKTFKKKSRKRSRKRSKKKSRKRSRKRSRKGMRKRSKRKHKLIKDAKLYNMFHQYKVKIK